MLTDVPCGLSMIYEAAQKACLVKSGHRKAWPKARIGNSAQKKNMGLGLYA